MTMNENINSNGVFYANLTLAEDTSVNALETYFADVLRKNKGNRAALQTILKGVKRKVWHWFEKDEVMTCIYTYLESQTRSYIKATA